MLTVVLSDGQEMVRSGLRQILDSEEDLEVVAVANGPEESIRYTRGHKPDVLVMDPGEQMIDSNLIDDLHNVSPSTEVVVLANDANPRIAQETLRSGATGVVVKNETSDALINAIRSASDGKAYINPRIAADMARLENPLSEREMEILRLIALGYTNQEMAQELFLSVRTIESHRAHINHKMGFTTRRELVSYAIEHKMLQGIPAVAA